MKKNVGFLDKMFRLIVAAIIIGLYFAHIILGVLSVILLILAGILIVTTFIGFCPLYFPFGISTKKKKEEEQIKNKVE